MYTKKSSTGQTAKEEFSRIKTMDPTRLFVVCGRDVHTDELHSVFGTENNLHGLLSIQLGLDRTRNSRGFAFIRYDTAEAAACAVQQNHGTYLPHTSGQRLKVMIAKESNRSGDDERSKRSLSPERDVERSKRCRNWSAMNQSAKNSAQVVKSITNVQKAKGMYSPKPFLKEDTNSLSTTGQATKKSLLSDVLQLPTRKLFVTCIERVRTTK